MHKYFDGTYFKTMDAEFDVIVLSKTYIKNVNIINCDVL